jgi:hypothetical protein
MKKLIVFSLFCLMISHSAKSQDDLSALENHIMSKISIETESLYSPLWESVFTGNFFKVVPWLEEPNGASSCGNYIMRIHDGEVSQINLPGSDEELPWLLDMLKEDFRLAGENDVAAFESALDAIFPLFSFEEDKKGHQLIDGKWYFIRGEFFEAKTAIIVTTDAAGKPVNINYMLKAIE